MDIFFKATSAFDQDEKHYEPGDRFDIPRDWKQEEHDGEGLKFSWEEIIRDVDPPVKVKKAVILPLEVS